MSHLYAYAVAAFKKKNSLHDYSSRSISVYHLLINILNIYFIHYIYSGRERYRYSIYAIKAFCCSVTGCLFRARERASERVIFSSRVCVHSRDSSSRNTELFIDCLPVTRGYRLTQQHHCTTATPHHPTQHQSRISTSH